MKLRLLEQSPAAVALGSVATAHSVLLLHLPDSSQLCAVECTPGAAAANQIVKAVKEHRVSTVLVVPPNWEDPPPALLLHTARVPNSLQAC